MLLVLVAFLLTLVVYRWQGGTELVCGCFADFESKTRVSSLIWRNLLLLLAGLPLLLPQAPSLAPRSLSAWFLATTVVLGVLLAWTLFRQLAEVIDQLRAERNAANG
jgi:hypothetical protein